LGRPISNLFIIRLLGLFGNLSKKSILGFKFEEIS